MILKSNTICASIILHLSLCTTSNAFSTNLATRQVQRYVQGTGDLRQIDGMVLHMASEKLSKVEALLAKAKLLRAQAEADETQLQSSLIEQKASRDTDMDSTIDELFQLDNKKEATKEVIAKRITSQRPSSDLLLRVVDRLHQREIAAKGLEYVESSVQRTGVTFKTTATENKEELARIEGFTDVLIGAAKIVDEDFARARDAKGKAVMHSLDRTHFSSGELFKALNEKKRFLQREYDTQFKKRQAEFVEAARRKEDSKYSSSDMT